MEGFPQKRRLLVISGRDKTILLILRMTDAAAETAAALQFLACAIVREEKFASLLMKSSSNESFLSASSTFRDLKDDASIAKGY